MMAARMVARFMGPLPVRLAAASSRKVTSGDGQLPLGPQLVLPRGPPGVHRTHSVVSHRTQNTDFRVRSGTRAASRLAVHTARRRLHRFTGFPNTYEVSRQQSAHSSPRMAER
jgi:hypothetical protein